MDKTMPPPTKEEIERESMSWLESRRLVIAQLESMDKALRELSSRVDSFATYSREQLDRNNREQTALIAAIQTRLAIVEYTSRIWSVGAGIVSGAVATAIFQAIVESLKK
jgi:hypothetical protein